MKINKQWLQTWVDVSSLSDQELASILTMLGLSVEGIAEVAGPFTGVIVAKVLETRPHPEADKLTICLVDAGESKPLQIVCGASNVRPHLYVALAKVGAVLPNGVALQAVKLRNEYSYGMLCSAYELGMADKSEGILELPSDATIGMDLREYLALADVIFELDLTPNRGDCLSVQGVAREVATKLNTALKPQVTTEVPITSKARVTVEVDAADACPLYTGRVITNIRPDAATPLWMKEQLRRVGIRPLHPVVDVTQYVMWEYGQPLHAFDADTLHGDIHVRFAEAGETCVLLDGKKVTLSAHTLVIADQQGPLALAGIMGGQSSAVTDKTKTLFLESAFFTPKSVAGVARQYGLVTDASHRFERGVDPVLPLKALERATHLLLDIMGGEAGPVVSVKHAGDWFESHTITFKPAHIASKMGLDIPLTQAESILSALGCEVVNESAMSWKVSIPSYRFDLNESDDLVEEVMRVYGYDKLPTQPISAELRAGHLDPLTQVEQQLSCQMASLGYHQSITYSFVDPQLQSILYMDEESERFSLVNPLSTELSEMRVSLWPGLLAALVYNLNRQQTQVALFECGRVFETKHKILNEIPMIAAVLTGITGDLQWGMKPSRGLDFYDMKGDVTLLFQRMGIDVCFVPAEHPALHPGKSAKLMRATECVGWCGVLHPQIASLLDIGGEVMLFEYAFRAEDRPSRKPCHAVSKFPTIRRDIACMMETSILFAQVEEVIYAASDPALLKSVQVFDVYTGTGIPAGSKSVAIALGLQSDSKTLTDKDINEVVDNIIHQLKTKLAIVLRDGG